MTTNNNGQANPNARTRRRPNSSGSSTANHTETTNNNPQSTQTPMNPTFQLLINAIGKLIVSIMRFILVLLYSGFKFVNTICVFCINLIQEILNRLP